MADSLPTSSASTRSARSPSPLSSSIPARCISSDQASSSQAVPELPSSTATDPSPPEWCSTFFTGLVVESTRYMSNEGMTKREADFIVSSLEPQPLARILDVPTGNGRLAIELARRGFRTAGVDISTELIDEARANARSANVTVDFAVGDMRGIESFGPVDAVVCVGNSFPYFMDAGNEAFVRAVRATLVPGGGVVLQVPTIAEVSFHSLVPSSWHEFGDLLFLRRARYDAIAGVIESEYTLLRGDQRERKTARYRVYTLRELLALLRDAGFVEIRASSDFSGTPIEVGSRDAWIVARRPVE
jgi:2-polyprenyl-3-methyl-5-hydroxy-6-metoxy-1,4-benzoquinol methylase